MAVRLGTVAPVGFEGVGSPQWLAANRELGCQSVQVYRNADAGVSPRQMRDAVAAGGMPCDSLHGIFGEQFDPSCPDEIARLAAVDAMKREGELVLELGGDLVVVHPATIRREGISAAERLARLMQLGKSVRELGEFGRSLGVRYAFENLPGYHAIGYDVAELVAVLRRAEAPNVGMCLDTGHANLTGTAEAAAHQAAAAMIFIHFNDNLGKADDHLMPSEGTIDLPKLAAAIAAARYSGTLMLEVFYPLERLRALLDGGLAARMAEVLAACNRQ
jgi:sugar phosphate isomerase/epimerase